MYDSRNHGVSFEEASELFRSGVDYLEIFDDAHSVIEDRFIAIGPIRRGSFWSFGPSETRRPFVSLVLVGQRSENRVSTALT